LGFENLDKPESDDTPKRTSVTFSLEEFENVIDRAKRDGEAGNNTVTEDYYPEFKKRTGGKTRTFPLNDHHLLSAIREYMDVRLENENQLKANDPLLRSQKVTFYSANTLQQHIGKMLRVWGGFERASSHSGRRTLATNLLHNNNKPLATVQKILGHKDPSTTVIYHEGTEEDINEALKEHSELLNK